MTPEPVNSRIAKTLLLSGVSEATKKQELRDYFHNTFSLYESLFDTIQTNDAYYLKPEPLRHPLIFYFGHTATFFINKLILGNFINQRISEKFESMFAVGVDEMSWDDLNDNHYDWPSVENVRQYRSKVRKQIDQLIANMSLDLPITQDSLAWVLLMGIEHERIHLETSSVIIRMLPLHTVHQHEMWEPCQTYGPAPDNTMVTISATSLTLGKSLESDTYGWDNEYGQKTVDINTFKTSKHLVSNQEFLEFVNDSGYLTESYWTDEGIAWLRYTKAKMPRFWYQEKNEYYQRNLLEQIKLPLNWPVEVNYLEAKAFCNWKSRQSGGSFRLPTEAEWSALREMIDIDQPHWDQAPGNTNLEYYASSCPVDHFAVNGIYDIVGNVWQWTETAIDGYPGFKVHELYDDFSTPTFDGKHNLFKGGSWISTGNETTKHSRYAFRRHFFQHAGFRYVETETNDLPEDTINFYETDELVSRYLHFHYGANYFDVENYALALTKIALQYLPEIPRHRALDLGCSVGRATFELARYFDHVDGIDFSARFIQHGFRMLENGKVRYTIPTEGDLVTYEEANLETFGYEHITHKVNFAQGDACNLKSLYSNYDVIFCANLIDRLYDPRMFLRTIPERLTERGYLIISSPYTWLEEHTEKSKWLGGTKVNGENFTTLDGLKKALTPQFELVTTQDIPFVIRETQRKFQYGVAEMSIWKRVASR